MVAKPLGAASAAVNRIPPASASGSSTWRPATKAAARSAASALPGGAEGLGRQRRAVGVGGTERADRAVVRLPVEQPGRGGLGGLVLVGGEQRLQCDRGRVGLLGALRRRALPGEREVTGIALRRRQSRPGLLGRRPRRWRPDPRIANAWSYGRAPVKAHRRPIRPRSSASTSRPSMKVAGSWPWASMASTSLPSAPAVAAPGSPRYGLTLGGEGSQGGVGGLGLGVAGGEADGDVGEDAGAEVGPVRCRVVELSGHPSGGCLGFVVELAARVGDEGPDDPCDGGDDEHAKDDGEPAPASWRSLGGGGGGGGVWWDRRRTKLPPLMVRAQDGPDSRRHQSCPCRPGLPSRRPRRMEPHLGQVLRLAATR